MGIWKIKLAIKNDFSVIDDFSTSRRVLEELQNLIEGLGDVSVKKLNLSGLEIEIKMSKERTLSKDKLKECLFSVVKKEWIESFEIMEKDLMIDEAVEIDNKELIGSPNFKKLINEFESRASYFKVNHLESVFSSIKYIFSIDDGCGLTTALINLFESLNRHHLINEDFDTKIEEIELKTIEQTEKEINERLHMSSYKKRTALICFDCSQLLLYSSENVNKKKLSELLYQISNQFNDQLMVFRFPYLEESRLKIIEDFFNDVINVRRIVFSPPSEKELFQYAKKCFLGYGFTLLEESENVFSNLLSIEKRDGRSYGFRTVSKLVKQVLYSKAIESDNTRFDHNISSVDINRIIDLEDQFDHFEKLEDLIGLEHVKQQINEFIIEFEQRNSSRPDLLPPCRHMMFTGNPGCGKTTMARIVGQKLKEVGLLSIGNFYELSGRDLVGEYIGTTAPKTTMICRDAKGSVLFIDEAYALAMGSSSKDYGREALAALIAEMENNREDFIVILAGYPEEMEKLFELNPGLKDRVPYHIHFPDYSNEELFKIFIKMVEKNFLFDNDFRSQAFDFFSKIDVVNFDKTFGNARMVRNLYERVQSKVFLRLSMYPLDDPHIIKAIDFERAVHEGAFLDYCKPSKELKKTRIKI